MNLWQHEDTGRICATKLRPSERWFEIPTIHEDDLPEDISETVYDWWYENSFVDGVRMGPLF